MSLRWIPAKAKLGQVQVPEQPAQGTRNVVLEKIIYGGLVLAGAAAFITFVFGSD